MPVRVPFEFWAFPNPRPIVLDTHFTKFEGTRDLSDGEKDKIRDMGKGILREHDSYRHDPVLGEALCKVIDVAEPGDFISFICGLCGIQWSRGFDSMAYGGSKRGGVIPEGGASVDAVKGIAKFFEKVTGIDFKGMTPGAFCLNANSRCPITDREFCRCPKSSRGEGKVKADLLNIACTALVRLHCVPYFMNVSGSSSNVDKNLLKHLEPHGWYKDARDQNVRDGLPTLDLLPSQLDKLANNSVTEESVHLQFFTTFNPMCFGSLEDQKEKVEEVLGANDSRLSEILAIVQGIPDYTLAGHCQDPRNGVVFGCDMDTIIESLREVRRQRREEWLKNATPKQIEEAEKRRRNRLLEWRKHASEEEIKKANKLGYDNGILEWRKNAFKGDFLYGLASWIETASEDELDPETFLREIKRAYAGKSDAEIISEIEKVDNNEGSLKRLYLNRDLASRDREATLRDIKRAYAGQPVDVIKREIEKADDEEGTIMKLYLNHLANNLADRKSSSVSETHRSTYQAVENILNNDADAGIETLLSRVTALDSQITRSQAREHPHLTAFRYKIGFMKAPDDHFNGLVSIEGRVQRLLDERGSNLKALDVANLLLKLKDGDGTRLYPSDTLISELAFFGGNHRSDDYKNAEVKAILGHNESKVYSVEFKEVFGVAQTYWTIERKPCKDSTEARKQFSRETALLKYLLTKVIPTDKGKGFAVSLITAVLCRRR